MSVCLKGLMLQDLVSAKLISDYTVIEIPDSINDLKGTSKVRFHYFFPFHCILNLVYIMAYILILCIDRKLSKIISRYQNKR